MVLVLGANLLVLGAVVLTLAGGFPTPDPRELKRVASPDGAYDAVLLLIPPRFGGGGAAGSDGHYDLYVVEAGEEVQHLPRSESKLLIVDDLRPAEYEVRWQDERTLEFDHYPSGEVLRFGCSPYPREMVHTDAGTWSTKMPDDVCPAGDASPGTA